MKYLRVLLSFTAEVAGIIVIGYVIHESTEISSTWIGLGVALLLGLALLKLLLLFLKLK